MALLPDRVVSIDGCWTWFNSPPVYDAARQRTYAGWVNSAGRDTTLPVHTTFSVASSPGGIRGVSSAPARFSGVSSSPQ